MVNRLRTLWKLYRRFGAAAVARAVSDRIGQVKSGRQVIEVVWLEAGNLKLSLEHDPAFEFRFLDTHEVAGFAKDPSNDLDEQMVDRAAGGLDLCFAALCDGRLAAYGWYALDAIEGEHNFGVAMSYPSTVAYMYKGFTHPDFRGARLHGLGMGLALKNLKQFGVTALVSTVAWTNEASLRSCDRLGYQRLGRIITSGRETLQVEQSPQAAVERGVKFGADAVARQPRLTASVCRESGQAAELVGV
jgi:hypothetical protein